MNRQERAKQFMAFDALKGLQEELRKREERHSRIDRKHLSEEQMDKISNVLVKVRKDAKVGITFYCNGHYLSIEGYVTDKSDIYKYIKIGNEKIFYDDIYKIRIIEI